MEFGIYIAKFKNSLYNKDYGKDILGSYVIGETNLSANRYSNFEEVESIVKNRILDEARKNNGKKGFASEIKNWDKDVLEFEFLTLSSEKKNIDDRIRAKLENFNVGFQIKGTEFFKTNLNAQQLKEKILESETNPCNFQRTLTYNQDNFRRDIINKAKNILNKYHEVLLYLFCRVGKSAISLQIASEISNTKHILIITAFPNAKNSFKEYTVNHKNMMDYYFYDKDNLADFNPFYKNVTFLSTAALRVKEDEDDIDIEDKEIVYKRINELKQKGFNPDVLIIDETHNGISSPNTDKVINTLKETFSIKNIIHNSATPFNDFKSGRFEKEQTIQYDFLTLKLNNFVNYPNLEMISLPYYKEEKDFVNILFNSKLKGNHKILFMENVDYARKFVETYKDIFKKKKIEIEYIDDIEKGVTTEEKTNNFQNQFEKTIIVTVNKLTTGVTLPKTDAVVLAKNIKSSERLIQIMSRPLTRFEGKDNVYFYTIGSDNIYIALDETRRAYNIANDNEKIDAFAESLKRGFLKVSEAVFENGDDLDIHELGISNIMSNVREWSCHLSNISNKLLINVNITENQIKNFDTFSSSGLTKVANTLKLIQEEGTRKIRNIQNSVTKDFCQKLKDRINLDGNKIEKKEVERNITVDELIRNWFMCIISSLNTWLLTKEINSFEDIAKYVSTKYELEDIQKVVFEKILSDNENLLKERIVDFNALFFKFNDMPLIDQSKKSKILKDLLDPEITKLVQNNKVGAGYPKEILEDMTKDLDLNSKTIAILDDLDLSMTNYLINTLNINESYIYLICGSEESYEIMEKSYNIKKEHLLKVGDVVNENSKKKL